MTPHPATGTQSHGTGDMLLASALMAVGIPLDPLTPCEIVNRDDGRSYARFHLLAASIDGKLDTQAMLRAWSKQETLPANHPFAWMMDFISTRPRGVSSVSDWLGWAVDYCRAHGVPTLGLPGNLKAIPDFVAVNRDTLQGYVFAFVDCRDLAFLLYKKERRVKVMQSREGRHSLIDTRLPAWQQKELLSRLDG